MVWVLVLVPVLPLVVCRGNLFAKSTRRSLSHNKVLVVKKVDCYQSIASSNPSLVEECLACMKISLTLGAPLRALTASQGLGK